MIVARGQRNPCPAVGDPYGTGRKKASRIGESTISQEVTTTTTTEVRKREGKGGTRRKSKRKGEAGLFPSTVKGRANLGSMYNNRPLKGKVRTGPYPQKTQPKKKRRERGNRGERTGNILGGRGRKGKSASKNDQQKTAP